MYDASVSYDPMKWFKIRMTEGRRNSFKLRACELKMNMQWVAMELIDMVIRGEPTVLKLLEEARTRRQQDETRRAYYSSDVDTIFDVIESQD